MVQDIGLGLCGLSDWTDFKCSRCIHDSSPSVWLSFVCYLNNCWLNVNSNSGIHLVKIWSKYNICIKGTNCIWNWHLQKKQPFCSGLCVTENPTVAKRFCTFRNVSNDMISTLFMISMITRFIFILLFLHNSPNTTFPLPQIYILHSNLLVTFILVLQCV